VSKAVDPARVYTEGKGEAQPVADNRSAAGRAQNRRVIVEVVGTRTVGR
jgi:OOP family OmpA-OmpF porin